MITVLKPLPSYFSFAVSATFADDWRRLQQQECVALLDRTRQQMGRVGIFPDAKLVSGEKVRAIIQAAKQYRADLLVIGMKQRTTVSHGTTQDVAERSPCAVLGVP